MKPVTLLLGVCLLVLCTAPVHALFAGDDVLSGIWCPADPTRRISPSVLENDIPNTPSIIPVMVEDAKNGIVYLHSDGSIDYYPDYNMWDVVQAGDSFRYRTFDGIEYSNVATARIWLVPAYFVFDGESLKFSTPKDTMLSAQILDDGSWTEIFMEWDASNPTHGTLMFDNGYWVGDEYYETGQTSHFRYMPDPGFEGVDLIEYRISIDTGECGTMWGMPGTIEITVGNPHPIPEFPSTVLPVIFVIGFVGAVQLIRRTREH